MIFGVKEVRQELGRFNGEGCAGCTEGYIYRLVRITRFVVIFFISLIPLGSRYETVCDSCEAVAELDKAEGKRIAKTEFRKRTATLNTATALKLCALALVLAAAVVLPLTLIKPALLEPQALKDMITEDGTYMIQTADGHVMGIVDQADGEKTLTYFEATSRLTGEPGADGSFIRREHYTESADGTVTRDGVSLKRLAYNPGLLEDRNGVPVRTYKYDEAAGTLSISKGVDNLSDISYTKDRAEYPFDYTATDGSTQQFYIVLHLSPQQRVEATFVPSGDGAELLAMVAVKQMDNGRIASETAYLLMGDAIADAKTQGIGRSSTADEITAFIADKALTPTTVTSYTYFENTKVFTAIDFTSPDDTGAMETLTQQFDVVRKGGYYIQKMQDVE